MDSVIDKVRPLAIEDTFERAEVGEGMRRARERVLAELPGLAIGAVTIFYIIMSFASLWL